MHSGSSSHSFRLTKQDLEPLRVAEVAISRHEQREAFAVP